MKQEERLLDLIGQLPDELTSQTEAPRRRRISPQTRNRWIGIGAAACLVVAVGIWGATSTPKNLRVDHSNGALGTADVPASTDSSGTTAETPKIRLNFPKSGTGGVSEAALAVTMLPVNGHIAEYVQVENAKTAARARGFNYLGESCLELDGWYLPDGADALRYLIHQEEDGSHTLWEFSSFVVWDQTTRDMLAQDIEDGENTFWDGVEWFSLDMDFDPYPYREVLETVYGVTDASDILSVTVAPASMDNSDAGKRLQAEIGTRTVTDRAELDALYSALVSMTCYGGDQWEQIELGSTDADGSLLTRVRLNRYLTIGLADGSAIVGLKYSAAGGQFYEFTGIAYSPLDADASAQINEILGIEP